MIYFLDTFSGLKVSYSKIHKRNPYGWRKNLPSNYRIAYDGPEEGELWETYCDFVDLLERTRVQKSLSPNNSNGN